jgi:hypothetical protein
VHHCKRRRSMKTTFKFGFAVLLAALFLVHPLAACAAMWQPAEATAHPCCPRKPQPATAPSGTDCCIVSAPPVSPVQVNAIESLVWGALANTTQQAINLAEWDSNGALPQLFSRSHLFVAFHQLLI